jgi:nucleoside-diphosphate-sugar epimerase
VPSETDLADERRQRVIAVTGAAGALGRRVVELLVRSPAVAEVVAIDRVPVRTPSTRVVAHRLDIAQCDPETLRRAVDDADTLVHLAFSPDTELDPDVAAAVNIGGTERILDALTHGPCAHLVALSSAAAYGAWPTNPVPLTENAPLRPVPEFTYAMHKAAVEQLVGAWRDDMPERSATVLRPTTALAERDRSWLAGVLADAVRIGTGDHDPPRQFLHLDDLARAIALASTDRLDGAFNVAPDGWLPAEEVRALIGGPARVRLPERVAVRVAKWSWQLRRGPVPPGLLPYVMHPWVVSNDRLRAAGWEPANTNAEAFVAGTEARWWQTVSPKRRQELALGAAGVAVVGGLGAASLAIRAALRRRAR